MARPDEALSSEETIAEPGALVGGRVPGGLGGGGDEQGWGEGNCLADLHLSQGNVEITFLEPMLQKPKRAKDWIWGLLCGSGTRARGGCLGLGVM